MNAATYWSSLVTAALLGTDRRDPPTPPIGPLAELAADLSVQANRNEAPARLLQQVAAVAAMRRGGLQPASVVAPPSPPAHDARPVTPPSATATWQRVVADWPVLDDEWVLAVLRNGLRLAPELVVPMLTRHRTDQVRHARVVAAAGPLADWLVEWSPRLACPARAPLAPVVLAERMAELPEVPITPDLQPLLALGAEAAEQVVQAVAGGLSSGALTMASRGVLVNLIARVHPGVLTPLSHALQRVDPSRPTIGLAFALADLARLRAHMLTELEPR